MCLEIATRPATVTATSTSSASVSTSAVFLPHWFYTDETDDAEDDETIKKKRQWYPY